MKRNHNNSGGIGSDNWLHILSHVIALYSEEGGAVIIRPNLGSGFSVELPGIQVNDPRLHRAFGELVDSAELETVSSSSGSVESALPKMRPNIGE